MIEAESDIRERRTAYALLRLAVGVNLTMHGISRLISGPGEFAAKLVIQFTHAPLPAWSVWGFALMLPSLEAILGLLILLGLRTRAALIAATLLIAVLTFGSAISAGLELRRNPTYLCDGLLSSALPEPIQRLVHRHLDAAK